MKSKEVLKVYMRPYLSNYLAIYLSIYIGLAPPLGISQLACQEIETACITDVLTRAGADVTVASVSGELQVRMSRGLNLGQQFQFSQTMRFGFFDSVI